MNSNDKADAAWDDYIDQQQEEKIEQLERELNAATSEVERLRKTNLQLREGAEEQKQRIKRLEEAGDELVWAFCPASVSMMTERESDALKLWNKAKEAKP